MTLFAYSLAKHRPELYENCILPTKTAVRVVYNGDALCLAMVPENGVIVMDLPEELIKRLETGKAMVLVYNNKVKKVYGSESDRDLEIAGIGIFDRD